MAMVVVMVMVRVLVIVIVVVRVIVIVIDSVLALFVLDRFAPSDSFGSRCASRHAASFAADMARMLSWRGEFWTLETCLSHRLSKTLKQPTFLTLWNSLPMINSDKVPLTLQKTVTGSVQPSHHCLQSPKGMNESQPALLIAPLSQCVCVCAWWLVYVSVCRLHVRACQTYASMQLAYVHMHVNMYVCVCVYMCLYAYTCYTSMHLVHTYMIYIRSNYALCLLSMFAYLPRISTAWSSACSRRMRRNGPVSRAYVILRVDTSWHWCVYSIYLKWSASNNVIWFGVFWSGMVCSSLLCIRVLQHAM